jgi:hypothetical protein
MWYIGDPGHETPVSCPGGLAGDPWRPLGFSRHGRIPLAHLRSATRNLMQRTCRMGTRERRGQTARPRTGGRGRPGGPQDRRTRGTTSGVMSTPATSSAQYPAPPSLFSLGGGSPTRQGQSDDGFRVGVRLGPCEGASHAALERDHASEVPAVRRTWAAGEGERDRLHVFVCSPAPAARQQRQGQDHASCAEHRRDREGALEPVG